MIQPQVPGAATDTPRDRPRPSRPAVPLSRERILATALSFVDEHGLDALSMRRLATELGVEPMSLYHHVANKDAVIDGMVGRVLAEVQPLGNLSGSWQERIREAGLRLRKVLVDHPRAAAAVATRPAIDATTVALTEDALAQLTSFGLSLGEANEVLWLCNAFVMGTTVTRAEWSTQAGEVAVLRDLWNGDAGITPDAFPLALAGYGETPISPEQWDRRFDLGFDILLAGIAARYPHIHDPVG